MSSYDYLNQKSKNSILLKLLKISFIFLILVLLYFFYLSIVIRNRISGKIWKLPTIVYSKTTYLMPGMCINKNKVVNILESVYYRRVKYITGPGEFSVHNNNIELIRRTFDLPEGTVDNVHVLIYFSNGTISNIKNVNSKHNFGFLQLDPKLITIIQSPYSEQRLFITKNNFPKLLIKILLTIEDKNFYYHNGISFHSICRAILTNLVAKKAIQGGSTITQQLVKNLFLDNKRSLWRKFNEICMALILDYYYSKDYILELYLNEVYLGQSGDDQIRGFPLASLYYFNRPINELSIDQQAMLVGMVKGASLYNPWHNPNLTLERRNLILKLISRQHILDKELCDLLMSRPLGINRYDNIAANKPAFTQLIREEIQNKLHNKIYNLSGVKIFTTLDPVSQDAAEHAIKYGINNLKLNHNLNLEAAMVVVDRFSGEIRAIVGGSNPEFAGFNRAMQARRLIGSLIKPAIYLTALSNPNKYNLSTLIDDQPLTIKQNNGYLWSPKNYDRRFRGHVMLIDALIQSLNIPTVNLGMKLGLNKIISTLITLGVPYNSINYPIFPAMLLGAINLTPIEVAQLFQTIASGGNYTMLSVVRTILSNDGSIIYNSLPKSERVVSSQATYLTLYAMQQSVIRGTSSVLFSKFSSYNLAAKTGTSNDLRDSWFVGIDGKEVSVIWIGRDDNKSTTLTGSSGALTLYQYYLEKQFPTILNLVVPKGINYISVSCNNSLFCNKQHTYKIPIWVKNNDFIS
ncbi:MAG: bifunctional glycosyl transferase/transpeptidase [Candidatus Lightella neohaematopini]|nr:bifunctional glycosyl transferase/transpeptidase [Candidatus Lightella neohaematopini]